MRRSVARYSFCLVLAALPSSVSAERGASEEIPNCGSSSTWNSELQICEAETTRAPAIIESDVDQARCHALWMRAERFSQEERFKKAADTLVELYTDHRDDCEQFGEHDLCEVLFKAGEHFEVDERIGPAIQIWRRLFQECGDGSDHASAQGEASPWAIKGVFKIGEVYERIAAYTKAAQYYEEFTRRYPGEEAAPDAIEKAFQVRMALGHDEKALDMARTFERFFSKQEQYRARAATLCFSVGEIFRRRQSWPAVLKHTSGCLWRYRSSASPVEIIEATTGVGEAMLKLGPQMRSATKRSLIQAISLANDTQASHSGSELSRIKSAAAEARFLYAELSFERFAVLKVSLPFHPSHGSRTTPEQLFWMEEHLVSWHEESGLGLAETILLYTDVLSMGVATWEVAAMARMGQSYLIVGESLDSLPDGAEESLLQRIREEGHDLEAEDMLSSKLCRRRALELFRQCRELSTRRLVVNQWSRYCDVELARLDPEAVVDDELLSWPGYVPEMIALPEMIMTLQNQ